MKDHILKDRILYIIKDDSKNATVREISVVLNIDDIITLAYIEAFIAMGYVFKTDKTKWVNDSNSQHLYGLKPQGFFFLNQLNGFTSIHNKDKWTRRLTIAKIIANTLNASAIIAIGLVGIWISNKSTDNKAKEDEYKLELARLRRTNDSLKFVINAHHPPVK